MAKITLMDAKELPKEGVYRGIVKRTEHKQGINDEGAAYNTLVVGIEIDATDSSGNKPEVEKTYNLGGRGGSLFKKDFKTTQGRNLTPAELKAFDPDALFNNKPVIVRIKHIKDGTGSKAVVEKFIAPNAPEAPKA